MRKPEESLDDFDVKAAERAASEPPRAVTLRFGGDVEVLKPLVRHERRLNPDPATGDPFRRPAPNRLSWFQSAVAAALVLGIMGLALLSAIFIGMSDPSPSTTVASVDTATDPDDATIAQLNEDGLIQSEQALDPDVLVAENRQPAIDEVRSALRTARRHPMRRVQLIAHRIRRPLPPPQVVVTDFIPTTLIIYAENGEIKSRIEPQIAAVYQKPLTFSN